MVLSDLHMPDLGSGLGFIKNVRRRWPSLPVAAITAYPNDLEPLQGQPECPVLIVHKPFHVAQIEEALRLVLGPRTGSRAVAS